MNPDKLFDYLEGNLPSNQREEIEQQLVSDPQLQRQLAIAREIHKGMRGSREVLATLDDPTAQRGAKLGRRFMIAFIALVFLNVIFGLLVITWKHKPRRDDPAVRAQVAQSLEHAATDVLPPPSIADDINLTSAPGERDALAEKVAAAAKQAGGSAAMALPNEQTTTVVVEIPASRDADFRGLLIPLGASPAPVSSTQGAAPADAKKLLQIQIKDRPR